MAEQLDGGWKAFWRGFWRPFDSLSGRLYHPRLGTGPLSEEEGRRRDAEAIAADWAAVWNDLGIAIEKHKEELDDASANKIHRRSHRNRREHRGSRGQDRR